MWVSEQHKLLPMCICTRLQILQISDAVQQICILVKHQLVTIIQNRQEPPPCPPRPLDAASFKQNPFGFVSPATLPPRTSLLWQLNHVFPVLEASKFHHDEKIIGRVGVCRQLDLQQRKVSAVRIDRVCFWTNKKTPLYLCRNRLSIVIKDRRGGECYGHVDDCGEVPR